MKLLRITAEGLPLFKEKLDLCTAESHRRTEEYFIPIVCKYLGEFCYWIYWY